MGRGWLTVSLVGKSFVFIRGIETLNGARWGAAFETECGSASIERCLEMAGSRVTRE